MVVVRQLDTSSIQPGGEFCWEMGFDEEGRLCVPAHDPLNLIGVILKPDIFTSGNRIRLAGFIIEADYQVPSVLVAEG